MAKKSFSSNTTAPAAELFFTPAPETAPSTPSARPDGYKINYDLVETKSRRVQLLMQPTQHARLKAEADALGISFNELVGDIIQKHLDAQGD